MKIQDLNGIRDRIKPFLVQYLEMHGVRPGRSFRCINPAHDDKTPSCSLIPESEGTRFHCFGCNCVGDIFTAASYLEGRPLSGRPFLTDNVIYLAQKFGLELDCMELNEDEVYEMDTYRAYRDASNILLYSKHSDRVSAKLSQYGWSPQLLREFGVGSVNSFEDFFNRMMKQQGFSKNFLKEIDLDRKDIFSPDCLVFTIKDENGNPVGFAARNLRYEEELEKFQQDYDRIVAEKGSQADELKDLRKPKKYVNTAENRTIDGETTPRNRIYQKSKRLFGFHYARRFVPPLFVFEGYSDCLTAVAGGLKNSSAVGSTSFSKDHLELILNCDIKHIVFVLDADRAGEQGTERFIKLVEEHLAGRPGLRVEVIAMPEGSDDPDAYIRKYGIGAFRQLRRMDVFSWQLQKAIKDGEDCEEVAKRSIALIVSETSNILRHQMASRLSEYTGIPLDAIWRDVTTIIDSDAQRLEEQKRALAYRVAEDLRAGRKDVVQVLQSAQAGMDLLVRQTAGYDPSRLQRRTDTVFQKFEEAKTQYDLLTGWPIFDSRTGGIPSGKVFVTLPGKPNQGKSSLMHNLTWRILDHNKNVMVLFHTIDDAMEEWVPRFLGSRFDQPSLWFKRSGFFLQNHKNFEEKYHEARRWFDQVCKDERLIVADVNELAPTSQALEGWVRSIRQKYPERRLVVMGDNFHLYQGSGYDSEPQRLREQSQNIKGMANMYDATFVMSVELPVSAMAPGKRPRLRNIKGSSGMMFDSNMNIGVYNDLKDFNENAQLVWTDKNDIRPVIGPHGETLHAPMRKPIIELVFDKSKVGFGFDGSLYYQMKPESGRMDECTEADQTSWANAAGEQIASQLQFGVKAQEAPF